MKYRVVEDLDAPLDGPDGRFIVQHSPFGHVWTTDGRYADQLSAEIAMEKLAHGPRVVAEIESSR